MGFPELLALSAAGNVVLALAWLRARAQLGRAVHALVEVGEGRAEITRVANGIAVTHKIIKNDTTNIC